MGRLCVAAVECNYQEVDRQLKEQFIHDKYMLDKIIKEFMATKNDGHIKVEAYWHGPRGWKCRGSRQQC